MAIEDCDSVWRPQDVIVSHRIKYGVFVRRLLYHGTKKAQYVIVEPKRKRKEGGFA